MDLITINQEIHSEVKRLRELESQAVELGRKMSGAEADYERNFAESILSSDLQNMAANKADRIARGRTAGIKEAWRTAEVVYKANARAQENSRQILSVLQSLLKYME